MQTLLQNVGLALLELHQVIKAPVLVNDSVYAVVEITDIRPTSKSGRAVVTQQVTVFNQNAVTVMEYSVKRLLAGQPA